MHIYCSICGRDIDSIGQDNMSYTYAPLCEDCSGYTHEKSIQDFEYVNQKRFLTKKQFKFLMRYAGWSYFKTKHASYEKAMRKIEQITFMMKQKSVSVDKS